MHLLVKWVAKFQVLVFPIVYSILSILLIYYSILRYCGEWVHDIREIKLRIDICGGHTAVQTAAVSHQLSMCLANDTKIVRTTIEAIFKKWFSDS